MLLRIPLLLLIVVVSGGCSPASSQSSAELPAPYWEQMYAHHNKEAGECADGEDCEVAHEDGSAEKGHDPNKKATLILEYTPFFP